MQLVPLKDDGTPDIEALNAEFGKEYLADQRNPRWVAKPTVAYLWARTVTCKNCRATIPLLKTRWLCKKDNKRVLLTMEPNADKTGVVFGVETDVPVDGGNAAQRREHDKRLGAGTMTSSGAIARAAANGIMTMEDIRLEGQAGRLGAIMTAVVVDGPERKGVSPADTRRRSSCSRRAEAELDRCLRTSAVRAADEPNRWQVRTLGHSRSALRP